MASNGHMMQHASVHVHAVEKLRVYEAAELETRARSFYMLHCGRLHACKPQEAIHETMQDNLAEEEA